MIDFEPSLIREAGRRKTKQYGAIGRILRVDIGFSVDGLKIPDDLLDAFTMGGRIPIVYSDRKAFRPASVTLITESRRLTGFSSIKPMRMRRRC